MHLLDHLRPTCLRTLSRLINECLELSEIKFLSFKLEFEAQLSVMQTKAKANSEKNISTSFLSTSC